MKALKEIILGSCLLSTVALADQDSVIMQLALENAKVKPAQAMETALITAPGYLSEFNVDDDHDRLIYELEVINPENGRKTEIEIDAETGEVIETDEEGADGWNRSGQRFTKKKYQSLVSSEVTLQSAVEKAKELSPGLLVEAELEQEKGVVYFEIEMIDNQGKKKVIVDVASGRTIPVNKGRYDRDHKDRHHH